MLYFHGGGYVTCSPRSHRALLARMALKSKARVVAFDYRKAPEHPFPCAVEDGLAAYHALVSEGCPPERLVLGGDSAGGGLALAVLQRLRAASAALPACTVLLSPWVDLECAGASVRDNARYDYLHPSALRGAADLYLAGHDRRDPLVSALHADLSGLPPVLVQTGALELFRSENVAFVERAQAAGVEIEHELAPGMVHVYPLFAAIEPRAQAAFKQIAAFIQRHCEKDRGQALIGAKAGRSAEQAATTTC